MSGERLPLLSSSSATLLLKSGLEVCTQYVRINLYWHSFRIIGWLLTLVTLPLLSSCTTSVFFLWLQNDPLSSALKSSRSCKVEVSKMKVAFPQHAIGLSVQTLSSSVHMSTETSSWMLKHGAEQQ